MAPSKEPERQESGVQQNVANPEEDLPACQSCRKKKAKCTREQPCSHCVKFHVECVYDDRRAKPGLRAGAVEQLQRRVETLENMFVGQGVLWQQMWQAMQSTANDMEASPSTNSQNHITAQKDRLKEQYLQLAMNPNPSSEPGRRTEPDPHPAKRLRVSTAASPNQRFWQENVSFEDATALGLPPDEIVDELVEIYFADVHHWIPILHVKRFREQIRTTEGRRRAAQILHAIVAVCIRVSNDTRLGSEAMKAHTAKTSRQRVILCSMESFSVANLQALVIIAFDTIGSGRGPSSWSIVGSMTRTVEQLQLSVEEDDSVQKDSAGEVLIQRMTFLKPSLSWSEAEERRRVFWAVFLMDRFCSVSTGWNISLTSADVKRRLPCEGALWAREQEVRAPYFGISDKRGASNGCQGVGANVSSSSPEEQDAIGGFAYCIEAMESLALITNFFLQHAVDVNNAQQVQLWLIKFKELDLRLVQWKSYLPQKWREASVLNDDGVMDSNLTLAHITHNTAVILLHQGIAYPPSHWRSCPVRLPSSSSTETCIEAASEISTIVYQFLRCSAILVNPQFSFCLFIAGRMLLTHSAYNKIAIPPELDTLISSLLEIAQRWAGPHDSTDRTQENLASGLAKRLIQARGAHSPTLARTSLDIRQAAYSEPSDEGPPSHTPRTENNILASPASGNTSFDNAYDNILRDNSYARNSLSLVFPPLPLSFQQPSQQYYQPNNSTTFPVTGTANPELPFAQRDNNQIPTSSTREMRSSQDLAPSLYTTDQYMSHMTNHAARSLNDVSDFSANFQPETWIGSTSDFIFDTSFGPSQRISRYGKGALSGGEIRDVGNLNIDGSFSEQINGAVT